MINGRCRNPCGPYGYHGDDCVCVCIRGFSFSDTTTKCDRVSPLSR
jgi:hypothetical protein